MLLDLINDEDVNVRSSVSILLKKAIAPTEIKDFTLEEWKTSIFIILNSSKSFIKYIC